MCIYIYIYIYIYISEYYKGNIIFKRAKAHLFAHSLVIPCLVIQH